MLQHTGSLLFVAFLFSLVNCTSCERPLSYVTGRGNQFAYWWVYYRSNDRCYKMLEKISDAIVLNKLTATSLRIYWCDMAFIVPTHHNEPNITFLLIANLLSMKNQWNEHRGIYSLTHAWSPTPPPPPSKGIACTFIDPWNKLQINSNQNRIFVIHENAFDNVVWKWWPFCPGRWVKYLAVRPREATKSRACVKNLPTALTCDKTMRY